MNLLYIWNNTNILYGPNIIRSHNSRQKKNRKMNGTLANKHEMFNYSVSFIFFFCFLVKWIFNIDHN